MRTQPALSDSILVRRFRAVAEETRLGIVRLLSRGERCVCELQAELDAAQSRLSFHLKKLKEAGVIADRKDGRWVYYRLIPEALEEMRFVLGELRCCEDPAELVVLGVGKELGGADPAEKAEVPSGRAEGGRSNRVGSKKKASCCP